MTQKDSESRIKLNLQWINELIGEDYKYWSDGSVIIIETQTGTGKTTFIKEVLVPFAIEAGKKILFICNRINLRRQVTEDLLKVATGKEAGYSPKELDEIELDGITIKSYQKIQEEILNDKYNTGSGHASTIDIYDYIILDECHYIFADSNFNNTTRLIFEKLIQTWHYNAVKIFITATAHEIKDSIRNYLSDRSRKITGLPWVYEHFNMRDYTTGTDYRYINSTKYFKNINDIIATIQNDMSDDKWIVFVSNIEKDGRVIEAALGEQAVFITKDTESSNPELQLIINEKRFSKKVLITTRTLDNGISIEDESVRHIAIMTWNEISFIQMLGRRRVKINNADKVNLYIHTRDSRSFRTLQTVYENKIKEIELCNEDLNAFNRKYDNSPDGLGLLKELFYRHEATGEWTVNPIGADRLYSDKKFVERMIKRFQTDKKFAFVKEQLSWIGLEDTFDESNLIENVMPNTIRNERESYLSSIYEKGTDGVMLMKADRDELIEKINIRDGNGRLFKSAKTLNSALEELGSQFRIKSFETSRNGKSYKSSWRIIKQIPEEQ